MSKNRASDNVSFAAFDDLFGIPAEGEHVEEIPLKMLHDFKNHPFRVLDDEKMEETVASIREQGIIVPGIVRPRKGGGYEIISGHRRKRAAELAGLKTMPAFIRDFSDEQATCLMVDSNIQREDILPSEKARAYRMKYDQIKSPGVKGNSLDELGNAAGESGKTVQRYLWLSNLIDGLMELVDTRKIGMAQGIDLSFLGIEEQGWILEILKEGNTSISMAQSSKIKELYKAGELTRTAIKLILEEIKPKPRRFVMKADRIAEFFPEEMSEEEIEDTIITLLENWKKNIGHKHK